MGRLYSEAHKVIILPEGASVRQLERIRDEWDDGRESAIEQAKVEYVYDRIGLEELEARVAAALRGRHPW
jgi:hypothetical protein